MVLYLAVFLLTGLVGWRVVSNSNHTTISPQTSTVTTNTNQQQLTGQPTFNKNLYSLDDPTSLWIVVNKARPLAPLKYAPSDLVFVGNGQRMRTEAAKALASLIKDASKQNLKLTPLSGYRAYQTQVSVYNNEVSKYGQKVADSESAKPGYSEHQTGWALDIGGGGCGIEDCFGNTAEGKWLAANAYKYGFIIRYTAAKQAITGYRAEPWHIRYIGQSLASEMHKTGYTTLEEFFGL